MVYLISLLCVIGFILIHLFSRYVTFLQKVPRSKVLSVAGGVSIAYVFMYILPKLNAYDETLAEAEFQVLGIGQYHVYLVAMAGLTLFYGLERTARVHEANRDREEAEGPWIFRIHMLSYFSYNLLIGYLLLRGDNQTLTEMMLFFIALSVHFVSNDHGLRQTHRKEYDRYGRYTLAAAVFLGWLLSLFAELNEHGVALLFSVLAGTMVLTVLKEELPEERESDYRAFIAGVILYTLLLYFV
ncbi:hypothetical protein CR205_18575 [Alteribacter lacisalsi]|uniref:Uncharacterized protein n=1 Tax=Alteribacter lacisalsi TaxID=2045244 RepID=A0A2W0H4K0_9BACI|nr:hypothetical protein [Alteribacter lacisalsi]PYZ95536.1 hypothetical protein CR205_18575 [Alteribacter lacisalsi]